MQPWNDWYHCNGNTHGTWLPGDPRGFRTRHHREHVEGDYKDPPPKGMYEQRHDHAEQLTKRPAVHLSAEASSVACDAFAQSMVDHDVEVLIVAIDDHHFHCLARFPNHDARKWIGIAKKQSARALSEAGLTEPGGVWAVRFRALPITGRQHQVNVYRYIERHGERGSAVWVRAG